MKFELELVHERSILIVLIILTKKYIAKLNEKSSDTTWLDLQSSFPF
jgi:hypothetical protein